MIFQRKLLFVRVFQLTLKLGEVRKEIIAWKNNLEVVVNSFPENFQPKNLRFTKHGFSDFSFRLIAI